LEPQGNFLILFQHKANAILGVTNIILNVLKVTPPLVKENALKGWQKLAERYDRLHNDDIKVSQRIVETIVIIHLI
jgi:hypothetical protein